MAETMKIMLALALVACTAATASTIDAQRGHRRMLIVFAPAASPRLAVQRREVDAAAAEFAERDLWVIEVAGDRVTGASTTAAALRSRYQIARRAFRVVLVGRDGGVKLDSSSPVTATRLTATIDAMPMRQDEMRRR